MRILQKNILVFLVLFLACALPRSAGAALPGWDYRSEVIIDNVLNANNLTNHQVYIKLGTQSLISAGQMQDDGDDIRFTDSDDVTILSYWIESGINTASTIIWIKVPSIPASDSKTIYLYYGNSSATSVSSMNDAMVLGEVGTATVSSSYSTVNLTGTYTSPIVVARHVEGSDEQEVSPRIRNVDSNSFDIKLHHPGGIIFNANTAYYLVIESGVHSTIGGTLVEAYNYNATNVMGRYSTDNTWGSVSFQHSYSAAPVVFSQVMTENDAGWITETIRNVTSAGMDSAMERAELAGDHANETMGWIAMETDKTGTINNIPYETATSGDNVLGHDNGVYTTNFSQIFSSAPIVISDRRKRDGGDGGWVTIDNVAAGSFGQYIDEDRVGDAERSHTSEDTSIIAYESAGQLVFRKFTDPQPKTNVSFPISQLVFITPTQTIFEDEVSSIVTVQTQNQFGFVQNVGSDTIISLSSTSGGGQFSLTNSPFIPVDSVTIIAGQNSASFYYRDSEVGTSTITAAELPSQGWTPATQQFSIEEVVLYGPYKTPITIDNTGCASNLTNYQVLVDIDTQTLIADGKMQDDGDDIRFADSDDTTILNYWIESGINTASTLIWVKVSSIPASDTKTIYLYYGDSSATPASSMNNTMVLGEAGTTTVSSSYSTVNLTGTYTSPIVVARHEEGDDEQEVSPRIRNVDSDSFDIKLHHPGGSDFNANKAYYLVVESGQHSTLDDILIEAHSYKATNVMGRFSTDDTWGSLSFKHLYSAAPVVFSQVITENDAGWITEAIRNVTFLGMQSAMERAELAGDHANETIGWIAMETGQTGTINGIPYETKTSGDNVFGHDNGVYTTSFSQTFGSPPIVISDRRRRDGGDGGWVTIDNVAISSDSFGQYIDEDRVGDAERSHTSEDTSIIACGSGQLAFRSRLCNVQPSTTIGVEELPITQISFTTSEQTIIQNEISDIMSIETQDVEGNPKNVISDTVIDLSSSSLGGEFSDDPSFASTIDQIIIPSGQSTAEFYYRDADPGIPTIAASENPSRGWTDAEQEITILSSVSSFLVEVSSPQVVDEEFTMTVTALNDSGGVAASYSDSVDLLVDYVSPTSGEGVFSIISASNFINGVAIIENQTFSNCGKIRVVAVKSDDFSKTGISSNVIFAPASFLLSIGGIDISASGSFVSRHVINKPFTLSASAMTSNQNVCTGYQGPASLIVNYKNPLESQPGSITPSSLISDYWINGIAEITDAVYDKWGEVNFTCSDDNLITKIGISENITFLPKGFFVGLSDPSPSRTFYYNDEPFKLTVSARDYNDINVSNYQGVLSFSGTGFNLPEDYTFVLDDLGEHVFEDVSAAIETQEDYISVMDKTHSHIEGRSSAITIKEAFAKVFSNQGPVGSLAMMIAVVDSQGNIITEDDSTMFTVSLEEFVDNNSATSENTTETGILTEGKSTIIVIDNEAEAVTVTPNPTVPIKTISGTATFGTISGGGLGIQIYRELKEEGYE